MIAAWVATHEGARIYAMIHFVEKHGVYAWWHRFCGRLCPKAEELGGWIEYRAEVAQIGMGGFSSDYLLKC